jgi:hypothetical protein
MLDSMSQKDKRTLLIGGIFIIVYLGFFYGNKLLGLFEGERRAYFDQFEEAQQLGDLFKSYETRVMKIEKLREQYSLNVRTLEATNLIGNAGRAIQDLVKNSGYKMGQIREVASRGGQGIAATLQLEGTGPLKSLMPLLHRFQTTGYPLIVDSFTVRAEKRKPGEVQWSAEVILLDYQKWKKPGGGNA